ncbi:hypothetical protein C8J56DRAFT_341280 [Mycena floridula]|nr:hypothetical protein C8J56DRAFT_341280 [Mycena floridula]
MKLKAAFPRYLWVYFNKAADPPVNTDDAYNFDTKEKVSTRVPKIKRAKEQIDKYPDRPEETLNITNITTSKSKAALRAILEEAPDTDKTMGDSQHLEVEILYPQDETAYSWKKEYLDKLYDALFDVIQEHGLGDEGWRSLRWEVYDKYVVCLKTMCYYPYVGGYWEDKARDWLFGRLVDSGPHSTRSKPALKYQNAVKDAQMW